MQVQAFHRSKVARRRVAKLRAQTEAHAARLHHLDRHDPHGNDLPGHHEHLTQQKSLRSVFASARATVKMDKDLAVLPSLAVQPQAPGSPASSKPAVTPASPSGKQPTEEEMAETHARLAASGQVQQRVAEAFAGFTHTQASAHSQAVGINPVSCAPAASRARGVRRMFIDEYAQLLGSHSRWTSGTNADDEQGDSERAAGAHEPCAENKWSGKQPEQAPAHTAPASQRQDKMASWRPPRCAQHKMTPPPFSSTLRGVFYGSAEERWYSHAGPRPSLSRHLCRRLMQNGEEAEEDEADEAQERQAAGKVDALNKARAARESSAREMSAAREMTGSSAREMSASQGAPPVEVARHPVPPTGLRPMTTDTCPARFHLRGREACTPRQRLRPRTSESAGMLAATRGQLNVVAQKWPSAFDEQDLWDCNTEQGQASHQQRDQLLSAPTPVLLEGFPVAFGSRSQLVPTPESRQRRARGRLPVHLRSLADAVPDAAAHGKRGRLSPQGETPEERLARLAVPSPRDRYFSEAERTAAVYAAAEAQVCI